MTDLRKAAEMALELLENHVEDPRCEISICKTIAALRQTLAQAEQKKEQEPEWIDDGFGTMWQKCGKKDCGKFVVKIGKVDCWNGDCPETTAPSKCEWVGLTDAEVEAWRGNYDFFDSALVKEVEAKLKEKNSG